MRWLQTASLALLAALVAPGTDASQVFGDAGFGLRTTREFALPVIEDIRSFLEERGYVSTRRVHVRKNGFLRAAFETK